MATLLNAVMTDTVGTGVATTTVESLIEIPGDSVFDGADVTIQVSSVDTSAKYSAFDSIATIQGGKSFVIRLPIGHFVRAVLGNKGSATSVTVNMIDIA